MDNKIQTEEDSRSALHSAREKTRVYSERLWKIITRYSDMDRFGDSGAAGEADLEPYRYEHRTLLRILSAVPWLLGSLFLFSFWWDFNGIGGSLFGYTLSFEGLLKIVSVSGLIGFLTNWLAITMLFRPTEKRPILGHGLIPAQKDRIAFRLAQAVSRDLINPEIIKRKIRDSGLVARYRERTTRYIRTVTDNPSFRSDLKELAIGYIHEMLGDPEIKSAMADRVIEELNEALEYRSFEKVAIRAYTFVKGQHMKDIVEEALAGLPASMEGALQQSDQLLDRLPEKLEEHGEGIESVVTALLYRLVNQLDVHDLVEENLRKYDNDRLTRIIRDATNEQLRYIQYLGAVLGCIGGLVIWEPVISVIGLGLTATVVVVLDGVLYRWSRN